jgi:cytochrome c oxidase assembly protein subunit 11
LAPGEKKSWPVVFVIDSKLSKDVNTITLSYTFFEVGSKIPAAPKSPLATLSNPHVPAMVGGTVV